MDQICLTTLDQPGCYLKEKSIANLFQSLHFSASLTIILIATVFCRPSHSLFFTSFRSLHTICIQWGLFLNNLYPWVNIHLTLLVHGLTSLNVFHLISSNLFYFPSYVKNKRKAATDSNQLGAALAPAVRLRCPPVKWFHSINFQTGSF